MISSQQQQKQPGTYGTTATTATTGSVPITSSTGPVYSNPVTGTTSTTGGASAGQTAAVRSNIKSFPIQKTE